MSEAESYATAGVVPWRWRILSGAFLLVALALLALVLAHWGWRWFGPTPVSIAPRVADGDFSRRIAEAHLFGATAAKSVAASEPAAAAGDLRLLGVFAQRDGRGYALFRAGARGALFVAAGSEAAPGVRLESVQPGGVTLVEGGVRRAVVLRGAGQADKAQPAIATASSGKSAGCAAPAGFAGPVIRLNAELLSGMIGTPDTWKALLQPVAGGLIVRDQSGFAGMMGLRNGDRVDHANGIALAIPDDIGATVLKPLTRSQPVWVSGMRDDKPQQWLYLNAGACPA
ncbi:MAG TPA: type II secretion system protein N [Casimicrobiaceae bacterium]|nr:type II secretion system protein N [Casimicrobiaceae bacterium]